LDIHKNAHSLQALVQELNRKSYIALKQNGYQLKFQEVLRGSI